MSIANYTTGVAVSQTMGEINRALARRGVSRISTIYDDDGNPTGVSFAMKTEYGLRDYELPIRVDGVHAALAADNVAPRYRTREQAERVAWRIAADWLRAQSALVDAGLALLDEVMMPYMVAQIDGGKSMTMYEHYRGVQMKGLER